MKMLDVLDGSARTESGTAGPESGVAATRSSMDVAGRRRFVGGAIAAVGLGAAIPAGFLFPAKQAGAKDTGAGIGLLGFPTHGANNYLGLAINDYSRVTNHPLVTDSRPYYEVGLLNSAGSREDLPDVFSDPDRTLGTTSDMATHVLPPGLYSPEDFIFNRPFSKLGTLFFGSQGVFNRQQLVPAEECDPKVFGKSFCSRPGAIQDPTLRQWNRVQARMNMKKKADGSLMIRLQLDRALPSALYTMWLVGITNNFTDNVQLTASPFGGLPNVILTDKKGRGSAEFEINFDPRAEPEAGEGKGGSLYVSVFWHADGAAYGGSPTLDFIRDDNEPTVSGQPVGVLGANHVFFPLQGQAILSAADIYKENR